MAIKIPQSGRFAQPNTSDLFGNLWYTRNMNFDEQGYAKLSSRTVSMLSEQDDNNLDMPISFGRAGDEFHIVSADSPYDLSVATSALTVTEDTNTNNPALSQDSWGKWFQNRWHASTDTKIWYTTGSAWTDTAVSLTTGKVHALETFKNKNSLAVSNGNTVLLLSTAYATTVTLTIPSDFEIVGLSYSNAQMGVATMMSDTAAGQNQEAFFFVWDGASTAAGRGYPIGSDAILAVTAYKSSWVILTRTGELLYFNGGGFELLATLPFAFKNTAWGDSQNRITFGDVMVVESDLIYINVGNDYSSFGRKGETYVQNNPAGIWCYDPNIGLYHRYSPSLSPIYQLTVSSVDTATDILTCTGTIPATGNPVKCTHQASAPIGGVSIGKVYFLIKHSATTFSLAETKDLALAGVKVNLTSDTTAKFLAVDVLDFGSLYCNRVGGIGITEYRRETVDHLVFGNEVRDSNSSTNYNHINLTTTRFENRGCLVTAKAVAPGVTDNAQKVYVKYRPLDVADKIILKYKEKDVLGIPTSTPQWSNGGTTCSWTSDNEFTTTADLSELETYINDNDGECEVEVIAGAGAGQAAQITAITTDGTNYAITLSEAILGATVGNTCEVSIDNWKLLKTNMDDSAITYLDTDGYKEFPIATNSKWILIKAELRGSETCIEAIDLVNNTQLAAI